MKSKLTISATSFFLITCALATNAIAETPEDVGLRNTVHNLDQELFDAFNKCADSAELARHASYFAPDVEFYHDNGGVTWNRAMMLENTKKYACGNYTRELVEETFKASPVKDFGAISTGVHRFCQNDTRECSGEAEFVMVWRNTNSVGPPDIQEGLSGHPSNFSLKRPINRHPLPPQLDHPCVIAVSILPRTNRVDDLRPQVTYLAAGHTVLSRRRTLRAPGVALGRR